MAEEFIDDIISVTAPSKTEAEMVAELQGPEVVKTPEKQAAKTEDVADSAVVQESPKADAPTTSEIEELATQLGWNKDYKGEGAADATTFILKSRDIQNSMSQHNKDLKAQLQALNGSVDALKKHNESVYKAEVKKLESEIATLRKERRDAIELADVDKVEELDKQIEDKQKDINAPKDADKQTQPVVMNPAYDEWIKDNQWYLDDDDMAKFADAVAEQYVGAPPERVYKIVRTKVQEVFPEKFEVSKPEGQVKSPIGPRSPVERSSAKGSNASFTRADLTSDQIQIMSQFVKGGIMTEEQYIADIAKMQA